MSEILASLPENWITIKIRELFNVEYGKSLTKSIRVETGEFPVVGSSGIVGFHNQFLVEGPSIVIGRKGSVGSLTLLDKSCWPIDTVYFIQPKTQLNIKYVFYQLLTKKLVELDRSTTIPGLNRDDLYNVDFELCSSNEQTRIVEKLEELLSDLDNGVTELKAAQIKLTQYRQSLLKSAVEGSLTAEWRKQNPVTETGEQLLQRILTERRQRWEQQKLAEFKEKGKTPPKDWQKKYPEPVQPNITNLPELPEGWAWASLSQIGWIDRGRSKHRPRSAKHLYDGKYPFVQTGDIRNSGQYITSTSKTYSDAGLEQSKLWPKGTMCITIAANIGETAILSFDACFPDSVVGFIPVLPEQTIEYIEYSFRTLKEKLDAEAPATAQKNINLEILAREVLPLPPINEQKKILEELSKGFTQIDSQLTSLTLGLKQADAQRKNILKDAFSGQLVPQDPNDEPASVLLEKIKTERLAQAKQPKPKRIKKKANDKASIMDTLFEVLKAKGDWMDAQEAFRACGVTDGTETDRIEELYAELRRLDKDKKLITERKGDFDMIKLKEE